MDETAGITELRPPLYCVMPHQAFEAAGFEQEQRNEIKGTLGDHVFQFTCTSNKGDFPIELLMGQADALS